MRNRAIIGVVGVVGAALAVVVALASTHLKTNDETPKPTPSGVFEQPNPWQPPENATRGVIDPRRAAMSVGELTVEAPQPIGAKIAWTHELGGDRHVLVGEGDFNGVPAQFSWSAAAGNPNTLFSGTIKGTRGAFTEPVTSTIELENGELSYVDAALARVPFAGTPINISGMTDGPIVWRNGERALTLWQWRADRVTLAASENGGYIVTFYWWDPVKHEVPAECDEELADRTVELAPKLTISFAATPSFALGRLPGGVASAVVPIFVDPINAKEPKFRDAASASAKDYAARARTIALGHSSPGDARHGNGGLVGLEVGGTIVIPNVYDESADAFESLKDDLTATGVEIVRQSDLSPAKCAAWGDTAADLVAPMRGTPHAFDGKFPNLFAPEQRAQIPGFGVEAPVWHPTALTGRRKDVVTQALSSTYLSRLADVRGIAVLEIPIVATRNPLVAASAEALLEPERGGDWTIQEDLARALGGVELLSEDERFDFVGIGALSVYSRAARRIVFDGQADGSWLAYNDGADVEAFTIVVEGSATVTVDGGPVESTVRRLPNDAVQTWFWWDLQGRYAYKVELVTEQPVPPTSIDWQLAAP